MSRGSTASARTPAQLPSQAAWAKGQPQHNNSSTSSLAPSQVQSISASHSRHPNALSQVSIKEGVSVPQSNVGSARQGLSLNFGSIDDAPVPVSSSLTATPMVKNESVKSFGSLPAMAPTLSLINGRSRWSSVSSRHPLPPMTTTTLASLASSSVVSTWSTPPTTSSMSAPSGTSSFATSSTSTPSTTTAKSFIIAKLFQGYPPASQPSSVTSSPSIRSSNPPDQQPSPSQQPQQPPAQVGQLGARSYTPFAQNFSHSVPNGAGAQSRPMAGPGGLPIPASSRLTPPSHPHPPDCLPSAGVSTSDVRSAPVGLGIAGFKSSAPANPSVMGQFHPPGSKLTGEEQLMILSGVRSAYVGSGPAVTFQGEYGSHIGNNRRNRTCSKREEKRNNSSHSMLAQQGPSSPDATVLASLHEPVTPLEKSCNRWVPSTQRAAVEPDTLKIVMGKVRALLSKLTIKKFDSISDQIIAWTNKSKDGRTLNQVIGLIFEKAIDEPKRSEMYALLCHTMMMGISPEIRDNDVKTWDGGRIISGKLLRKYLLSRCQENFDYGWVSKEATGRAAAANEQKKNANELFDEYFASQEAGHRGLSLIKFMGELFKLHMLTERIVHECVKKLGNVENPDKEVLEGLCQLLRTCGLLLDVPRTRAQTDVYFARMKELSNSGNVSPRVQFMLQDVIELRERKWQPRNVVNAPTTLAQVHEAAYPWQLSRTTDGKLPILLKPLNWAALAAPQNTKFQFLPQTELTPGDSASTTSEDEPETTLTLPMSGDEAKERIDEDVKEFFAVRNLENADVYFTALPEEHHFRLINTLVASALESTEADARLVAEFFARPAPRRDCSSDVFEAGFMPVAELLDDIAIDAPKAFEYMAVMLKGAGFDGSEERLRRIAEKAMNSDKLLRLVAGT